MLYSRVPLSKLKNQPEPGPRFVEPPLGRQLSQLPAKPFIERPL